MQIHGADIEEPRPDLLIRDLAAINPQNRALRDMVEITKTGYRRETAGQLLQLARDAGEVKDAPAGGVPLRTVLLETLEVESTRASKRRFEASTLREAFMKGFFITHYRAASRDNASPKFLVVFGQSHSGRGIDRRGVSTLGNFVSELAVAEGAHAFHVLLFAAGGRYSLHGVHEIDQRQDDPGLCIPTVMIARGSLGNPWIFEELTGTRSAPPSAAEVEAELRWIIDRAAEHWGEERAARNLRKFYPWYVERLGYAGAEADRFQRTTSLDQVRELLRRRQLHVRTRVSYNRAPPEPASL